MSSVLFYLTAAVSLAAALSMVLSKSPMRAALSLAVALVAIAVLFVQLDAGFLAAMQLLIYAGAVMVLVVFVVMLLNLRPGEATRPAYLSVSKTLGAIASFYLLYVVTSAIGPVAEGRAVDGSVLSIGRLLLSEHLFVFEGISVLLLTAIVGAVVLGKKRLV